MYPVSTDGCGAVSLNPLCCGFSLSEERTERSVERQGSVTAVTEFQRISPKSYFKICHRNLIQEELGGARNTYAGSREANTGFGSGNPKDRGDFERPRRRCEYNIKVYVQEMGWGAWTGLIRLKTGTGGGIL